MTNEITHAGAGSSRLITGGLGRLELVLDVAGDLLGLNGSSSMTY